MLQKALESLNTCCKEETMERKLIIVGGKTSPVVIHVHKKNVISFLLLLFSHKNTINYYVAFIH